jgi:transposase
MTDKRAAKIIYQSGEGISIQLMCRLSDDLRSSRKTISALEKRIHDLEGQLAKNSRNSSMPPSSNRFNKPCPKSLREKTGRSSGGQKGHKGHTLEMSEHPDFVINHPVAQCEKCASSLKDEPVRDTENRQVFDLPPVRMEVIEHRAEVKICPSCGHTNTAMFPIGVNAPVQYGYGLKSIIVYLKGYQLIPYKRTAELLCDLFNVDLSQGTLDNIIKSSSCILQEPLKRIADCIIESPIAHFDETGCRVLDKPQWIHVASNSKYTYLDVHVKRGKEAIDDIGVLPRFKGRAIHDSFGSYFQYDGLHGLCNAHHLRELTYLHEEDGQNWAKQMKDCLKDIKKRVDIAKETADHLGQDETMQFETLYQLILEAGCYQNPPPERISMGKNTVGRQKKTKARNLLERLECRKKETLAFMYDFNVPFDNNQAERDIRMMKVQQKISGTFRSGRGAVDFCRIRSYISTARKNSVNAIEAIRNAFDGKPFISDQARCGDLPTPSYVPFGMQRLPSSYALEYSSIPT